MADTRGGFVISLDFELFWGVRDQRSLADYGGHILGARAVVPRLLDLFAERGIRATWATVGLLFFDDRDAMLAALPEERPRYADPRLSPYAEMTAVGPDERRDPYRFGLSLVRMIRAAPGQEIATHTFSHYYCLEPGPDLAAFRADLAAARAVAERESVQLESIVFPRNQWSPAHLAACREAGLAVWRGTEHSALYRPGPWAGEHLVRRAGRLADAYLNITGAHGCRPEQRAGLAEVPASRFLRPVAGRLGAFEPLRLRRIVHAMAVAASRREVFHLWFHPHNFGADPQANLAFLGRVLDEYHRLRDSAGWPSLTMAEAARAA